MTQQQNQPLLDLPKIIAVGIASPAGAALTSRFGVAGTLLGLALSAVIITVITDFLKTYLARVPGAVTTIPGGLRKKSAWGRFVHRIGLPFSKFASLSRAQWRRILIGSVVGAGIAFLVGLIVVTFLELSVGKNLSCWLWDDCPEAAVSPTDGTASNTGTLPSILSVGSSVSSNTQQGSPSAPRPGSPPPTSPGPSPESPSPSSPSPGSKTPNPQPRSGQQESSPNTAQYQQSSSEAPEYNPSVKSDQQRSSSNTSQYQQGSPESEQSSPEPQQGSSQYQQSSSETSGDQQQRDYQPKSEGNSSTNRSGDQQQQGSQREAPPIPLYWFTT